MRAAVFNGPRSVTVGDRPDPAINTPTDAIVRVTLGCVCGSDLWYYRRYLPELLEDVLAGRINPGRVFDFETDLEGIPSAYAAMDERRAVKALIRIGTAA